MSKVVELNLKESKEGPRKSVPAAVFVRAEGVKGDGDTLSRAKRQIQS